MGTIDISALRSTCKALVIEPGEDGYDEARSVWNGDHDRRPLVIARCKTADDVAAALAWGRGAGIEVAVRGGGHNFAGHAVCDDGLMIDLGLMNSVTVDPAAKRARCGGGATWADYDGATQEHGLASPGGVISHTGVGGLTLGGGIGWLSQRHGLSCDNLVSATVVTVDGRILKASADENPELFWALRGGGGNFGVVVEFEFQLHEVGPMVNLGIFFVGLDRVADLLTFARDFLPTLPADVGAQLVGLNAPPMPFVPEQFHFQPGALLALVSWGSPEEHAGIVAPAHDFGPLWEFVTPIPYAALQQMLDESAPWGLYAYEKALYLDDMTDAAAKTIATELAKKSSPLSIMPIFPLGGAYAEVADDATAFGGRRSARWLVNIAAGAPDRGLLETERAWVRAFFDALLPHANDNGSYVNFISDIDEDRVRNSYGPAKYDRLARVKAEYDPDNVLHRNANIRPAVPTS